MPKNKFTDFNEIVLSKEEFGEDLWKVVGEQLKILTRAGEICVVYDDDVDIVVIQHEHDDQHCRNDFDYYGVDNPHWLTPGEWDIIEHHRSEE